MEYKDLCKKAQELSSKGNLQCVIITTMKAPSDGNIRDITEGCEYLGVPQISPDHWTEPKVFKTPALSRIAKKISSNIQLQDLIPKLAAKNTRLVIDEMADIIDFPQKSNK